MKPSEFIGDLDDKRIAKEIQKAEAGTSGEIRVFISKNPSENPVDDAQREFERLAMHRTPLRNGVLLYFAPLSNRFAIYGDEGIHLRCGATAWQELTAAMELELRAGRFGEAVLKGIRGVGGTLAQHYPKHGADRNDLPNTVVRD
jgi:uncharacterized membrane protein